MTKSESTAKEKAKDGESGALGIKDFRRLDFDGWNPSIRTSQSTIWFKDALIVGTGRAPLGTFGKANAGEAPRMQKMKPSGSGTEDLDPYGAQVFRFNPEDESWTLIYDSPIEPGLDGKPRARDRSMRAAAIYQTNSDSEPALYVGMGSLERQVVFLRSVDGVNFEECKEHGLGLGENVDTPSVRCLTGLNGHLYTSPTGKNYGRGILDDNHTDYPMVYETDDPLNGHWRPVSEPAFGDPKNLSVNEIVAFEGHLYAATINARRGYQVWKTDAKGDAPYKWTKIIDDGAWRGPASSLPAAMFVFDGALYVTGALPRQGRSGLDSSHLDLYGPFPAELIRIFPDDSWELVSGRPRFTPDGYKKPVSGMLGGFDSRYTHVFWRFAEYQGWLYLATSEWRWFPIYLTGTRDDLSDEQLQKLIDDTAAYDAPEFGLWRSRDGANWEPVTRKGFGDNPYNYGIRELVPTPHGLFVVPTSTKSSSSGGGLEMWWGK